MNKTPLIACLLLLASLPAASLTGTFGGARGNAITSDIFSQIQSIKLGPDYYESYIGSDNPLSINHNDMVMGGGSISGPIATDYVLNNISSSDQITDCGIYTCDYQVQITALQDFTPDENTIVGDWADEAGSGVSVSSIYFDDTQTVEADEPIYSTTTAYAANGTAYNETVQTGTNPTYVDEPFQNYDLTQPMNSGDSRTYHIIFTKTSMDDNVDIFHDMFGQPRTDAGWWNASYPYGYPINCSNVANGMPIVINGSTGFTLPGSSNPQIAWTYCEPNETLYFSNYTFYAVANNSTEFPLIIESGNGQNYTPNQTFSLFNSTWMLNDANSGTTCVDADNFQNGTFVGSVANGIGMFGNAYSLAGGNNNCLGNNDSYNTMWASNLTFIGWINTAVLSGTDDTIFDSRGGSSQGWQLFVGAASDDLELYMDANTGNGNTQIFGTLGSGKTIGLNEWYQVAFTENSTNISFYLNGSSISNQSVIYPSILFNAIPHFRIGGRVDNAASFNGLIDQYSAGNVYLSSAQINQTFQNAIGTAGFGMLGALLTNTTLGNGTFIVMAGPGGSATGSNNTFVPPANLTINATPNLGYSFINWNVITGNCTINNSSSANTWVRVFNTSICEVQANFATANFSICNGSTSVPILNFTFFDQANPTVPVNSTMSMTFYLTAYGGQLIQNISLNESTPVASIAICSSITNGSYSVDSIQQYQGNNGTQYEPLFYYLQNDTITVPFTQNISLYDLQSQGAVLTQYQVFQGSNNPLIGGYIQIQRYYPATNQLLTVSMAKTDSNGIAESFAIANTVLYSYVVSQGYQVIYTSPIAPVSCDPAATLCSTQILINTAYVNEYVGYIGNNLVGCSVSPDNTSVSCTSNNPSGTGTQLELKVYQVQTYSNTLVCDNVIATGSGSVICSGLNASDEYAYIGTEKVGSVMTIGTGYIGVPVSGHFDQTYGAIAAIWFVFILAGLGFVAGFSGGIIMGMLGLTLAALIGFIDIPVAALLALWFVAGTIAYVLRG